jgi:hypothetical protein
MNDLISINDLVEAAEEMCQAWADLNLERALCDSKIEELDRLDNAQAVLYQAVQKVKEIEASV